MEDIYRMTQPQWFCVGDVWRHKKTNIERHILEGDCFPAWIVAARSLPDGFWDKRYMQPSTATNGRWELISRTTEMSTALSQKMATTTSEGD
jgi:hypothetical protein